MGLNCQNSAISAWGQAPPACPGHEDDAESTWEELREAELNSLECSGLQEQIKPNK